MTNTTQETQVRAAYEAPKLQKIEMSMTADGPNPDAPEGLISMGAAAVS